MTKLCPFFSLFCTAELFFWGGEKQKSDFFWFFPSCSPFSGGIPLEFQRLCTLPREQLLRVSTLIMLLKLHTGYFLQRVYFFNSFFFFFPSLPWLFSPSPWRFFFFLGFVLFFSLFGIFGSEVFSLSCSSVFVGEPRERSV